MHQYPRAQVLSSLAVVLYVPALTVTDGDAA